MITPTNSVALPGVLIADQKRYRGISSLPSPLPPDKQTSTTFSDAIESASGVDGKPVRSRLPFISLSDALAIEHDSDAHLLPYHLEDTDGQPASDSPRIRKEALLPIRAHGGSVQISAFFLDLDLCHLLGRPGKVSWNDAPDGTKDDLLSRAEALTSFPPFSAAYATRHGARFIHTLSQDLPAGISAEALLGRLMDAYRNAGIPVDPACSDWTRLYRAPKVTLEDGTQTWTQPWFWQVDHLYDDERILIPEPEDFLVTDPDPSDPSSYPTFVPDASRPTDEEAYQILNDPTHASGLTEHGRWAEKILRNGPIHPYIFGNTPFAREGHRHDKLTKMIGILVGTLHSKPWATQELAYALAAQAVSYIEQDEDWCGKAWEMIRSFWSKESLTPTPEQPSIVFMTEEPTIFPEEDVGPEPEDDDDEAGFSTDQHGRPYATPRNIRIAVRQMGLNLWYDEFADQVMVNSKPIDDAVLNKAWVGLEEQFDLKVGYDKMVRVLDEGATRNPRHPVVEYLNSLEWDGEERVSTWLTRYAGAEDTPFNRAVASILLTAAVRRIRKPGTKYDEMVVLESPQGSLKSSLLEALAVKTEWFTDALSMKWDAREALEQTRGRWIVEVPEFDQMTQRNEDELKAFLSQRTDQARLAYDRKVTRRPRQFVLIGTTNHREYLRDMTGNRRYWPVQCGKVELADLQRDIHQIWAEASVMESQGAPTRLDETLYGSATEAQDSRRMNDPFVDTFSETLGDSEGRLGMENAWRILNIPADKRDYNTQKRMARALRSLGWERIRVRKPEGDSNSRMYVYAKGTDTEMIRIQRSGDSAHAFKGDRKL